MTTTAQINLDMRDAYHQFDEVAGEAQTLANEYKELYQTAIANHEVDIKSMKNNFQKEIGIRETTIKIMAVAMIFIAGCGIFLAVKATECRTI